MTDFNKILDKYGYINFINKYHSNKPTINEENKYMINNVIYVENLLDIEMIFFEFCELFCLIIRKFCIFNNLEEKKEVVNEIYNKLKEICYNAYSKEKSQDKYKYYFPELQYHKDYWTMIQERNQK